MKTHPLRTVHTDNLPKYIPPQEIMKNCDVTNLTSIQLHTLFNPKIRPDIFEPHLRKIRATHRKRQFKQIVRAAIANRYWLEDMGDEQYGEDVKKNILLLLRRKKGKKLLTLEQKGLLCKRAEYRTKEEINEIFHVIGGFKCFRMYPPHVKQKLAGVTYFQYFEPGRVIVRQNQRASSLYFILTGEVSVGVDVLDPITNEMVVTSKGTMGSGQMFGEVSLLYDIPRTATITTLSHCEFLRVYRSDFDYILKETIQTEWDKTLNALRMFSYFDDWEQVLLRECCVMSKLVEYEPDEIIYGQFKASKEDVYFVVEGQCRLIEHMLVEKYRVEESVKKRQSVRGDGKSKNGDIMRNGSVHYRIFDAKAYFKKLVPEEISEGTSSGGTIFEEEESSSFQEINWTKDGYTTETVKLGATSLSIDAKLSMPSQPPQLSLSFQSPQFPQSPQFSQTPQTLQSKSLRDIAKVKEQVQKSVLSIMTRRVTLKSLQQVDLAEELQAMMKKSSQISTESVPKIELPDVQSVFMQVCLFNRLACFGLGEHLKHRYVLSVTKVKILQIPKYWLLQFKKGNLWERVIHYLDMRIPSSEEVFKVFVQERAWIKYKQKLVRSIVKKPPVNSYANVPFSIRLKHHEDTYYPEE